PDPAVASHPASPFEIGEQCPQSPCDGIRVGIDLQAVDLMPDKFVRASINRRNHRLAAAPCFQYDDPERLIPARHTHNIAGLIKIAERAVALETDEPRGV